jgi:hypothetical protein
VTASPGGAVLHHAPSTTVGDVPIAPCEQVAFDVIPEMQVHIT